MNETINTIQCLRSIRRFSDKEISRKDIDRILDATLRTANSGGRQIYSVVVVDDKEILKDYFYNGNKALLFCIDYNRWFDCAERLGYSPVVGDIRGFIMGAIDASMASQTATLAAKAIGIDSLVTTSTFRKNLKNIYELLNLPEKNCFPVIGICLGYPKEEPEHLKGRIRKGVIHYGKYQRLAPEEIDEVIKEYDDPDNHFSTRTKEDYEKLGTKGYVDNYFKNWDGSFKIEEVIDCYETLQKTGFLDILKQKKLKLK
ncbi:MAG: nitroreductase [Asgard group archaeon]|nr:nitroreductase [Asgard group archaeon]